MWKLDSKTGWVPKNWFFWTVVLKKTLESPLNCKEIKLVNPKGNQPCIFIGRTDAEPEAEAPIPWLPDVKCWLIGKDPDAGRDWGQEEKGMTGWDVWMASPTWCTWVWVNSGSWWWTGEAWHAVIHGVTKSRTRLSDWTDLTWLLIQYHQRDKS